MPITLEELPDVGVETVRGSQLLSCQCHLLSADGIPPPCLQPPHPCQLTQWLCPSHSSPIVPGLARGLFVSVGGEPILSDAAEPQAWHRLFVGRKAPLAFGRLWHLDTHLGTGMGAQPGFPGSRILAAKFTDHHHRGIRGAPVWRARHSTGLSVWGAAGGCSRELGSGALGSHPASVLSWLGSFG